MLTNVTHLQLSFIGFVCDQAIVGDDGISPPNDVWPTLLLLLETLGQNLVSLDLEGLARPDSWEDEDEAKHIPQELPLLKNLRHLSIVFCPIALVPLWKSCPAIETCQLVAGDVEEFWSKDKRSGSGLQRNGKLHSAQPYSCLLVELLSKCGSSWLLGDLQASGEDYQHRFAQLKRLRIIQVGDSPESSTPDSGNVALALEAAVGSGYVQSNLEELVLDAPYTSWEEYSDLVEVPGLTFPKLRRLWIQTNVKQWVTGELEESLSFSAFPALTDLWLPTEYVDPESMRGVTVDYYFDLSSLPNLRRLYLDEADEPMDFRMLALKLARHLPCLESVTCLGGFTISVTRPENSDIQCKLILGKAYRPDWSQMETTMCC